ncbi:YidC/Oxa1 family membrane protein insertase [Hyphomicrobiales bacterium]|nr:YidC/Oxa1 family membrane protein insertase [Hyphomicrobiales bacterium]
MSEALRVIWCGKSYFPNFTAFYMMILVLIKKRCEMKYYDELRPEMEEIQQQMVEAKKNERTDALKEVKRLRKEFGFAAGMLKGALAEGRAKK